MKFLLATLFLALSSGWTPVAHAEPMLGAYGYVTPEWAARFRFNYTRGGFLPDRFPERYRNVLETHQRLAVDLIHWQPGLPAEEQVKDLGAQWDILLGEAKAWSVKSVHDPRVLCLLLDDFVACYYKMLRHGRNGPKLMLDLIAAAQSVNPALPLGITLYEDEIGPTADEFLNGKQVVNLGAIRGRIGFVSFYLHNRTHVPQLREYVEAARLRFPNAKIVGGIYTQDRRPYEAKYFGRSLDCPRAEEQALFRENLVQAWRLAQEGRLDGVELFPASYGQEEDLRKRRNMTDEEYETMLSLRDIAADFLGRQRQSK